MPPQPTIDFAAGALPRLLWALAFIAAVVVAVRGVMIVPPPNAMPVAAAAAGQDGTLEVDATYAVAAWSVLVDGRPVVATTSDERRWRGLLPVGGECTVEATPTDPLAGGAAALRGRLTRAGRTRTIDAWGDGTAGLRFPLADGR